MADLLNWHYRNTAPPLGNLKHWRKKDFIAAIEAVTKLDPQQARRNVDNWLSGKNRPNDIEPVIKALFNPLSEHDQYRQDLREAWGRLQSRRPVRERIFSPPVGVPPRNPNFRGRTAELSAIRGRFLDTSVSRFVALCGMSGIGKTSLAAEYVYEWGTEFDEVVWCVAKNRLAVILAMAAHLKKLDPDARDESDPLPRASRVIELIASGHLKWLIVLDNVPSITEVEGLLPQQNAAVLITSRLPYWSRVAYEVPVAELELPEAATLLKKLADRTEQEGADRLAIELGRLPLALDHAGNFCKRSGLDFVDYARELSKLIEVRPANSEYPDSVFRTFKIAIEAAIEQSAQAEFVMAFLCVCAAEAVPVQAILHSSPDLARRSHAIATLAEFALIQQQPTLRGTSVIIVHRLVQLVGRHRWSKTAVEARAAKSLANWLSEVFPPDAETNRSSLKECEVLAPHVLALRSSGLGSPSIGWSDVLNRAGMYFAAIGEIDQALDLANEALAIAIASDGVAAKSTGLLFSQLALVHISRRDFSLAQDCIDRALLILQSHPTALPDYGAVVGNLGLLKLEMGDWLSAEKFSRQASLSNTEHFGPMHRRTLAAKHNLTCALYKLGRTSEAIELMTTVFEKILEAYPRDDVDALAFAASLAGFRSEVGDNQGALDLKLWQLEGLRQRYEDGDLDVVLCALEVAEHYYLAGDPDAAAETVSSAAAAIDRAAVERSGAASKIYADLAFFLSRNQTRHGLVFELCLDAEARLDRRHDLPVDDPTFQDNVSSLLLAYANIGHMDEVSRIKAKYRFG